MVFAFFVCEDVGAEGAQGEDVGFYSEGGEFFLEGFHGAWMVLRSSVSFELI